MQNSFNDCEIRTSSESDLKSSLDYGAPRAHSSLKIRIIRLFRERWLFGGVEPLFEWFRILIRNCLWWKFSWKFSWSALSYLSETTLNQLVRLGFKANCQIRQRIRSRAFRTDTGASAGSLSFVKSREGPSVHLRSLDSHLLASHDSRRLPSKGDFNRLQATSSDFHISKITFARIAHTHCTHTAHGHTETRSSLTIPCWPARAN